MYVGMSVFMYARNMGRCIVNKEPRWSQVNLWSLWRLRQCLACVRPARSCPYSHCNRGSEVNDSDRLPDCQPVLDGCQGQRSARTATLSFV